MKTVQLFDDLNAAIRQRVAAGGPRDTRQSLSTFVITHDIDGRLDEYSIASIEYDAELDKIVIHIIEDGTW